MKPLAVLTVIFATTFASCTTPQTPESPSAPVVTAPGNPLLGTWKFDSAASTVHTVTLHANSGTLNTANDRSKDLLRLSGGSTVTFTADTMTLTLADGRSTSMDYTIKSQDGNGNIVIANSKGNESSYSVSGNRLINPAPDLNFVAVYAR